MQIMREKMVTFGQKPTRKIQEQPIPDHIRNNPAAMLRQELLGLVTRDTAAKTDVFKSVNATAIKRSVEKYLKRQARTDVIHPFIIQVAGGTASGKTTVAEMFEKLLDRAARKAIGWSKSVTGSMVGMMSLDNYIRNNMAERAQVGNERFFLENDVDSPDASYMKIMKRHLSLLKQGYSIRGPYHHFPDSSTRTRVKTIHPSPILLVEGLHALNDEIVEKADLKIFVDVSEKVQKDRWYSRIFGRNPSLNQSSADALFNNSITAHKTHVLPTRDNADIVINGDQDLETIQNSLRSLSTSLATAIVEKPQLIDPAA